MDEHIRRLIELLPARGRLRQALQRGAKGTGIHYPWMDEMRQDGVKRVLVRTRFEWRGRPTEVTVAEVLYFSKYEDDCAQISDPKRLQDIRSSGLERDLEHAAVERTESARWYFAIDKPVRHGKRGVCAVELLDDEWLPVPPPMLAPVPKSPDLLVGAVLRGDQAGAERHIKEGVGRKELSAALSSAATSGNPCMVRLLLSAGADVNAHGEAGYTPLIEAVRARELGVVKVLLEAGADATAKDRWGETALSVARREHDEQIIELLTRCGASE